MSLHQSHRRHRARLTSSPRSIVGAAGALLLVCACRGDLVTTPVVAPLTPGAPALTLTGAAGTPIFPSVSPGETQPGGDARGLNRRGQVTGAELGLVNGDDDFKPYRWMPGSAARKLVGCCDFQSGNDINDAGQVIGYSDFPGGATLHYFLSSEAGGMVARLPVYARLTVTDAHGATAVVEHDVFVP